MDEMIRKADVLMVLDSMLKPRLRDLDRAKQRLDAASVNHVGWVLALDEHNACRRVVDELESAREWIASLEVVK